MTEWLTEYESACPYCGEPMPLQIDLSAGSQDYIEDCTVCCRPIEVHVQVEDGFLNGVQVNRDDE